MVMDAHLSVGQPAAIWNAQRVASVGVYTDINGPYHYSWQGVNTIVVGIGLGPGNHRNFTCAISNRMVVTLVMAGGALPVGGANGINQATLLTSVTAALRAQFRILLLTDAFNNLGRSAQTVAFQNTRIVNRHATRRLRIGAQTINGGQNHVFVGGNTRGFVVYQFLPGTDTYYRNYDVREVVNPVNREELRVIHRDPVQLSGTVSGDINIVKL